MSKTLRARSARQSPVVSRAREDVPLPSMVLADGSAIDPAQFGARQVALPAACRKLLEP